MLEISNETNDEFFKNKNLDADHQDLGTITIHTQEEQDMLVKYLEELVEGKSFYKPAALKFE